MGAKIDLVGQKFNMLTVEADLGDRASNGEIIWLCLCDCGNYTWVKTTNLKYGNTGSCGCAQYDRSINNTDGYMREPAYVSWRAMKKRCFDKSNKSYPHYGGRGITVCERWMKYENFKADMGERPFGKTLHRLDEKHGDYEPDNCIWSAKHTETTKEEAYA